MRKVYLSIDAHARHCTLGMMSARGKFERTWTFKTSESELVRHVDGIEAKKILAIEEGPLAYWIAQTLRAYVHELVIADPRENPLISRNAMKRDKVDAKQLCRLLRLGELKHVYHPQDDRRAVFKASVQQYLDFRDQETALKRKIKAKYRSWGVPDVEGTRVYSPKKRSEYLKKIKVAAVRNQLSRLYVMMDHALAMQESARTESKCLGQHYPEIKEFVKVPGIGDIGALVFDSYIQTPDRFTTKSKLHRYCQLAVTDRSSDGKQLAYKRLDKAGNSELKAMSYRAFTSAMRIIRPNEVRAFYEASLRRTKNHTRARLNTQRKILSVLHGIWRSGQEYKPELFMGSA
jgi:transposase